MGRKWNNIKDKKHQKMQIQAVYTRNLGVKFMWQRKQGEPDPESNQALRVVLERAKTYNVPRTIIDRAVEKAKGGSEENYDELRYEGFRPNGAMVIVDTLTNNVNRTANRCTSRI